MTTGTTGYTVLTQNANTVAWLRLRKTLLGASEVACVLGLSRYKSRLAIYIDKLSDSVEDNQSEWQEWGHRLEDAIAAWVSDTQGLSVRPSPGLIRSNEFPWLGATPDRLTRDGSPLELKTSDRFMKDDWADGPPPAYVIQVMVQMICLGKRKGYIAVLHGGNHPEFFTIEWDDAVVDQIIRLTRKFWTENVLAKIAPDPVSSGEAALAFPNPRDIAVEGGEALLEAHGAYGLLLAERVEIDEKLEAMKLSLQMAMADATSLTYTDSMTPKPITLFTWRTRKAPSRIDRAALTEAHPDIAAEFTVQGEPTRTFSYKPLKETA